LRSVVDLDLQGYRQRAEGFCEEIEREYYLHLAGHKVVLEIEPIYTAYSELFERDAVARLREVAEAASGGAGPARSPDSGGDAGRRARYLLQFALDGCLGRASRHEAEEAARLEASLEVSVNGDALPYRQVPVAQANEPDGGRRAALEEARNLLLAERLGPLYRAMLERSQVLCRELGWESYAAAYSQARGIDLIGLAGLTDAFLRATGDAYPAACDPQLDAAGVPPLGELRRSDLPRFFRAVWLDGGFPQDRLVDSFRSTLAGLGIDLEAQANVRLDIEPRPTKSPRAFCAAPRVPEEVHLVIQPVGGKDDYAALFHEGGHTEHYAHADAALPFEFRHLGDNAVTESFAFLLEHLTYEPAWLRATLDVDDPNSVAAQARAVKLVMLRRYCAKLGYELELHAPAPDLDAMPERYADLLGDATRVGWPRETWLADVDPGFYCACYLRAWALEAQWRRSLRERFGERWFERPEAGEWLRGLWRQGQRLSAEELAAETLGEELDLGVLAAELTRPPSGG
jgi:hypothetical protein